MSKRVKINFESIFENNYEIIDPKLIHETNYKIKEHIRNVKKERRNKKL